MFRIRISAVPPPSFLEYVTISDEFWPVLICTRGVPEVPNTVMSH